MSSTTNNLKNINFMSESRFENLSEIKDDELYAVKLDMVDYVVEYQAPTASNNYTWYRLYKSGWCEQGGKTTVSANHANITFIKPYADTNYNVEVTTANVDDNTGGAAITHMACNLSTTGFTISQTNTSQRYSIWVTRGFIAQS